ncbi:hypothetical protein KIN20_022093 [Parelaphostrongylus tenuis]|uniref:Uncharacterized protein n=1 Tax=Parelaphostrongylus tenuis TaxID=148309 RepID=A0AAD5N5A2_PARTN|nr:hypothetical protein KIN20_022093 [Parelaphostrongylus tenuis]
MSYTEVTAKAKESSTGNFTVTGSSLPVSMVVGATELSVQTPGIASSEGSAKAFVQRLCQKVISDPTKDNGRSSLLDTRSKDFNRDMASINEPEMCLLASIESEHTDKDWKVSQYTKLLP